MLLINDNVAALGAENNLNATDTAMSSVVGQLSSGLQIQTAADNPAGYSIAQSLQSEINGYGAAGVNAQTAVSVLQTAQGAMNQQEAILQQANTIATQAANTTTDNGTANKADEQEFASLIAQLDQIAQSTSYAGVSLLNTTSANNVLTFQVGPDATNAADTVNVNLVNTSSSALLGGSALSLDTVAGATVGNGSCAGRHQHLGFSGCFPRFFAEPDPGVVQQRHGRPAEPDLGTRGPRRRERRPGDVAVHFAADPRTVRHLGPVPGPTAPAVGPQAHLTAEAERDSEPSRSRAVCPGRLAH